MNPDEQTTQVRAGDLQAGDRVRGIVVVRVDPTTPARGRHWWGGPCEIPQVEVIGIAPSPVHMSLNREAHLTLSAAELVETVRYRDPEDRDPGGGHG